MSKCLFLNKLLTWLAEITKGNTTMSTLISNRERRQFYLFPQPQFERGSGNTPYFYQQNQTNPISTASSSLEFRSGDNEAFNCY